MPFADLHMHSSASDGTCEPAHIAQMAVQTSGLSVIALTDHDSLAGLPPAVAACAENGIEFVPGVEITTRYDGRTVHMLGYFVDGRYPALVEYLDENRRRRAERAFAMADLLRDRGCPVSSDDLRATGETPNRPLLARLLVERGCVANADEAFAKLLGPASPCYVDVVYPDTIEAMRLIVEAGGHPFIAHPARYRVVDLIKTLAREGMSGLEAYHTLQTAAQSAELLEIARDLRLGVSGGSDWHGDEVHHAQLGGCGLDEEQYRAFLAACGRA